MSRLTWMVAGLIVVLGCEQKGTMRIPAKVTPENVRRDVAQPVKTVPASSEQTKEEPQETFASNPPDRSPEQVVPEDARQPEASQVVKSGSVYSKQDREVFQKKLEAQIDEIDGRITDLRAKGIKLKGTAKANWDQMMAELDVKRDAARARLNKVVHASGDAWDVAKKEAEAAWDDLSNGVRDAWKKFFN